MNTYLGQRKSYCLFVLQLPEIGLQYFQEAKPFESERQFKEVELLGLRLLNSTHRQIHGNPLVVIASNS